MGKVVVMDEAMVMVQMVMGRMVIMADMVVMVEM